MSEPRELEPIRRGGPDPVRRPDPDRILREDLDALRSVSARDLPSLHQIHRAPAGAPGAHPGGIIMNSFRKLRAHPWLASGLAAAAVAVALLFVPISYQRITGTQVTLSLSGAQLSPAQLKQIAGEVRGLFPAGPLQVRAEEAGTTITTQVDDRAWKQVARLAVAYAQGLAERGIAAEAKVTPRVETVKGTVYAAAGQLIEINIQTEGMTDDEIAAEIARQMAAAGVPDAQVQVETDGDHRRIEVQMQRTAEDEEIPALENEPEFRISLDGRTPDPNDPDQKKLDVRVRRTAEMTDDDVIADVRRQLQEQGVDADVYYENGKLRIVPRE